MQYSLIHVPDTGTHSLKSIFIKCHCCHTNSCNHSTSQHCNLKQVQQLQSWCKQHCKFNYCLQQTIYNILGRFFKSKINSSVGKIYILRPNWDQCKCEILSLIYPYTYIYTEFTPQLMATASVAQSVEHWSRDPTLGVAFFTTGPGWVLTFPLPDRPKPSPLLFYSV